MSQNNLQPTEFVQMEFAFYNVTSIRGFTSIITLVRENNRILWVFPTVSKRLPIRIICFILITILKEKHPCKCIRVDEDSALEKSTDVTNLLVDELKIFMETTGGDAPWTNNRSERHNRSIHNIVRKGILDSNQHENKWFCEEDISSEFHRCIMYSDLENTSPHFIWYGKNPSIHELRTFGCDIYPIPSSPENLYDITQAGSLMGYTHIRATMKWWDTHTKRLKYC